MESFGEVFELLLRVFSSFAESSREFLEGEFHRVFRENFESFWAGSFESFFAESREKKFC